jgi:aspartate aminotransferase
MLSGKSVIRQISEWSTARGTEIGYENVFDYSLGNPSVPCPEHFTKTCIDLLQTKEPVTLHGYSPTLTIPAVRKAVAESLNRRFGMDYGMEHIFMATGAAGALAHAMRCVAVPGQDIITFAPFFPEYKPYVEGAGLNLKVVPPRTKDFQIDFDAFDAMLDENTAAVLINTPNNPSGAAYSAETLTGLADRLRAASAKAVAGNQRQVILHGLFAERIGVLLQRFGEDIKGAGGFDHGKAQLFQLGVNQLHVGFVHAQVAGFVQAFGHGQLDQ